MKLIEAIEYLNNFAEDKEWGDENLRLKIGGLTEAQIEAVEKRLRFNFPGEYRDFISTYDLIGFEIMNLAFYPVGDSDSFDERLIEGNRESENPFFSKLQTLGLIVIGFYEAHPICLSEKGEVYVLETHRSDRPVSKVADSFEEMIVLATVDLKARVYHTDVEDDILVEKVLAEMKAVKRDINQTAFWENLIRGV